MLCNKNVLILICERCLGGDLYVSEVREPSSEGAVQCVTTNQVLHDEADKNMCDGCGSFHW